MPQLHLYLPEAQAAEIRRRAEARGLSVSRYLSAVVLSSLDGGWPEGFFERVVGGWQGEPLERPPQGAMETRQAL